MSDTIRNHFAEAQQSLEAFMSDKGNFDALEKAGSLLVTAFRSGKKALSCGNGGSMCDAMHFAEELSGRFRKDRKPLPAISISDPSYITCTANDYGFDTIFSRYLDAVGNEGDVLLAISTSGNSANVVEAARTAKARKMIVIGLTGKDGGDLKKYSDVEIRAPHSEYADHAQEIHIKIIHALILFIEQGLK